MFINVLLLTVPRSFQRILILFDNFVDRYLIWGFQDNLLSIIIPKNLVWSTCLILLFCIVKDGMKSIFLFLEVNNIKVVFNVFKVSLFESNQSFNIDSLRFSKDSKSLKLLCEAVTVVSSANRVNSKSDDISGKSFIYQRNNNGPRIL